MNETQALQTRMHSPGYRRIAVPRPLASAVIAVAIAAAFTHPACAQQDSPAAGGKTPLLEEVIVTAQRRAEQIQDVPITITVINSDLLARVGAQDLGGITQVTPALRFNSSGGAFAQPTIRGVGSAVVTSGAGSNVGIYLDNFYIPAPLSMDFQLLNIESVQVLKGPQGTLFGHNTTGGAILVTTSEPSQETGGSLGVSYGNYNDQRYQGYFTTGVTDNIAVDAGAILSKGDGYVDDILTGSDKDGSFQNWTGRLGIKVELTDDVSMLFHYQHSDTDDPKAYLDNAYVLKGMPQTAGAAYNNFPIPGVFPTAAFATKHNKVAGLGGTSYRAKSDAYQLTLTFDLGFATLKSYTQYRELDAFNGNFNFSMSLIDIPPSGYVPIAQINVHNDGGETTTQEFVLTSTSEGRLQWTAGAFYLDWKDPFSADLSQAGAPYASTGQSSSDTVSLAGFADATYQLLDNLYLSAGMRYSNDKVEDAYYHNFTGVGSKDLPTLTGDRWTPRAVVRYTPTDDSSVYLSFSRGYKSGIYNVGGAQDTPVRPESIDAYELGYKYAANQLSFDLSTYYYDYKDLQVAAYTVIGGTTPASVVNNAAKARVYGIEGQVRYDITPNFSVNAGAAWTDAKYEKFLDSPIYTQCLDVVVCGAGYGFFIVGAEDLEDTHMVFAPTYTGNIGARYHFDLFQGDLALSGNLYYTSKIYFDASNLYSQDGYELLDLRAQWTDSSDTYSLALYGHNVTDSNYITVSQATQLGVGNAWSTPMTYGIEGMLRF